MNNQKPQKPTLSGQRFKTRKRGKLSAVCVLPVPAVGAVRVARCKKLVSGDKPTTPLCSSRKSFKWTVLDTKS